MIALKTFLLSLLTLGILIFASTPALAWNIFGESCKDTPNSTLCQQSKAQIDRNTNPLVRNIRTVANVVAVITAIGAVIMIILGAFNLIVSGGASDQVKKGKDRIIFSLVGVIVVALAWAITRLITDRIL
jgi:hypothetical protein